MGTDFIGHIQISPALSHQEREVVTAEAGPWQVSPDGARLVVRGHEPFHAPGPSLRSLIATYLRPTEHRLDGMVVGYRRDTRELFSITVTNNRVTERTLRPPEAPYAAAGNVIDLATRRRR